MSLYRKAISTTKAAVLIVVVIAVIGAGAYLATRAPSPGQVTTEATKAAPPETLVMDDWLWTIDDLNQLYALSELPWPNWLTFTVYQPLVGIDLKAEYGQGTINYLPGLATDWTVSSDGKTYTFNLRQGVKFTSGNQFNAYQVWLQMYGFYYLSANSTTWLESYDLFDMSKVNFGPSTISTIAKSGLNTPSHDALQIMMNSDWPIYVTNPNQIVFRLKEPFVFFPGTLVVFDGLIFDVQWVLDNGGFGTPTSFNSYFNQNPIPGTGPYIVTEVKENAYVKFSQNPDYWGKSLSADDIAKNPILDPGHVKNVIVNNKPDDTSRYIDLSTGVAHIAAIQQSHWNLILNDPQYAYFKMPPWAGEVALMGLNVNTYPTNIKEVRQAIVHAINYTDLYEKAYLGQMSPYVGPEYPAWKDFYNLGNLPPYNYDPQLAKQLLAKANIKNMPTFLFRSQAGCEACINAAQVVQANLADIGITVTIEVLQAAQYYSVYGNYQTNVANAEQRGQLAFVNGGFGWGPATLTPADYWVTFVSCNSIWGNWAGYCDPTVQKGVDAFTSSNDVSYIQSVVKQAQAKIYDDAPYAWIGTFGLWEPTGGSLVWKSSVISGFLVDPVWTGQSTLPIFNTVTFTGSSSLSSGAPTFASSGLGISMVAPASIPQRGQCYKTR